MINKGNKAVIEYNNITFNIPQQVLPDSVGEGDVIKIVLEPDKTVKRKKILKIWKMTFLNNIIIKWIL